MGRGNESLFFQVLYVLYFTRPRHQVSVYRTILYVRCKSGVTFVQRCFRDVIITSQYVCFTGVDESENRKTVAIRPTSENEEKG